MKAIVQFLAEFLRDKNDGSSYKRLTGAASFIVATVIAFTSKDFGLCSLFLGVSLGQGVNTLFEKKDENSY
jgi:hypothetical protein